MNPESGRQWERFLEYSALARAKPTFDAEERDWKLRVADRLQEACRAARNGGAWLDLLNETYRQLGLVRFVNAREHSQWFGALATADPDSARRALVAFLDTAADAEERFRAFATALEEATANGQAQVKPVAALALGAVCNFAVEPLSLPMMRPNPFTKLEELLGYGACETPSIVDQYAHHLGFARWLLTKLEESDAPVRDMLDLQSLIFIAAIERDFWAGGRLYRIGTPPSSKSRERSSSERDGSPYLSICAGFRNEAPYLQEWIEFHRLVGVERFFLYDAHSTDDYEGVLAPYVEEGVVIVHHWEGISHEQADTYNECLREHRGDSRWIAFIDCDEFLFSPTGRPLPEVLADYEGWPGVGVNWALFGTSGHVTKPPGLVIENYVARLDSPTSRFIKSIVDPARVVRCRDAHNFVYDSLLAVDENHYPIHQAHTKSVSFARLRLNHYVTKSEEEARGKLGRPEEWRDSRRLRSIKIDDLLPQERDEAITTYVSALRAALAERAV